MAEMEWPVPIHGVTESIVATLGPNNLYNFAALGVQAPDRRGSADSDGSTVTARTWGRTRTWRNFTERGQGVIQFSMDPVLFVKAAMDIYEQADPVHDSADAWVRVTVEKQATGDDSGTQWVDWELTPTETTVCQETVPTFNRGYAAVVEATVAASRLDVAAYDSEILWDRIDYCGSVTKRCGGPREQKAFDRIRELLPDREQDST
ncbi:DUF447 domain-containing protein [Halovenus rubra]|uniref:DUF447 domain-containing protein n=2 Tax=Halovenus rubra TaxID=869890 RepID=A0ABD5X679_9EURY|nr:DUF447 domain-containing protein [Halovenus rubra]